MVLRAEASAVEQQQEEDTGEQQQQQPLPPPSSAPATAPSTSAAPSSAPATAAATALGLAPVDTPSTAAPSIMQKADSRFFCTDGISALTMGEPKAAAKGLACAAPRASNAEPTDPEPALRSMHLAELVRESRARERKREKHMSSITKHSLRIDWFLAPAMLPLAPTSRPHLTGRSYAWRRASYTHCLARRAPQRSQLSRTSSSVR